MRLLRTMIFALAVLMTGTAVAQKEIKNFANMKVAKQGTTEYEAQRQAAIEALDTVIYIAGNQDLRKKVFGEKTTLVTDQLLKFVDDVCEKFKNDPVLMSAIAESFFTRYGNQIYGERRFDELKKMHPTFVDAYIIEGRLWHALAYRPNEEGKIVRDSAMLAKARVQFDSAKVVMPKNPEPYMVWMRLQAKYDDADGDAEIEKLKKAIPGYPADLEAARYYNTIAQGDYNSLLLNALNHYEKVDVATLDPTNLAQYSLLCNRANGKQYWERGLDLAKAGIKKDPNMATLYRFGLWNAGKAEKWDDAVEMGMQFFEKGDTIEKMTDDFKWLASARQERKEYSDAIQLFKRELELQSISAKNKAEALGNIVDCYTKMNELSEATVAYHQYEAFKRANNMIMDVPDYNMLMNVYIIHYKDTLLTLDERHRALASADSLSLLAAEVGTRYRGRFYNTHFSFVNALFPPVNDKPSQELLDCLKLMEFKMKEMIDDPALAAFVPRNTYYWMIAKYNIMTWYYYSEKYPEARQYAEYLMYDMPEVAEFEVLPGIDEDDGILNQKMKAEYQEYKSNAKIVYDNSGKRKR